MAGKHAPPTSLEDEIFDCFATDEVEVLKITSKLWVELKREADYGEENDLVSLRYAPMMDDRGEHVPGFDASRYNLLLMAVYVVDWNLPDAEGKTVRLPRKVHERVALMRKLDKRIGEKILGRILELRGIQVVVQGEPEAGAEADQEEPDPLSGSANVVALKSTS
jgi:hypothetical protein